MSHTTTIKGLAIRDVRAIRKAVEDLKASGVNCDLLENTSPRLWGVRQKRSEFVLRLHETRFDVGLDLQPDGTYVPVFDEHAHIVGNQLGADVNFCPMPTTREGRAQHQIGKFVSNYAKHAAINTAVEQGYTVEQAYVDQNQNVQLVIQGVG